MNDFIEGWLDDGTGHGGATDEEKKFYGVVTGIVSPKPDPLGLSRVAVSIPCIDELDTIAYARIASPTAGFFSGQYFIPNPGDSVLIAFEHGDLGSPYIIGSLWHNIFRPPIPLSQVQIRTLRTLAGNQIVFTEIPQTITIQTPVPPGLTPAPPSPAGPHASVVVAPGAVDLCAPLVSIRSSVGNAAIGPLGITLQAGPSILQIGSEGISITYGANLIRIGNEGILINGKPVNINPAG